MGYLNRRAGRSAIVLLSALMMLGCPSSDYKRIVRVRNGDYVLRYLVEKNKDGDVFAITLQNGPNGPAERQRLAEPLPLEEVFDPSLILSSTAPPSAAADIQPGNTVFGLGRGKLYQISLNPHTTPRELNLAGRLSAGVSAPGNGILYITSQGPADSDVVSPSVQIVNATTFALAGSVPLPAGQRPTSIAITPDGRYLYVASSRGSGVDCSILDTQTRTVVKTLEFANASITSPEVKITPDGGLAFVTANGVAVIDTATQSLSHTLADSALHLATDEAGTLLYLSPVRLRVANPNPPPLATFVDGIAVYDIQTSTLARHIALPDLSSTVHRIALNGDQLYISRLATNSSGLIVPELKVIDLNRDQVIYSKQDDPGFTLGPMLVIPQLL